MRLPCHPAAAVPTRPPFRRSGDSSGTGAGPRRIRTLALATLLAVALPAPPQAAPSATAAPTAAPGVAAPTAAPETTPAAAATPTADAPTAATPAVAAPGVTAAPVATPGAAPLVAQPGMAAPGVAASAAATRVATAARVALAVAPAPIPPTTVHTRPGALLPTLAPMAARQVGAALTGADGRAGGRQGAVPRSGFGWPLAGFPTVLRGFDAPDRPYGPGHRGVDLGGRVDQTVLAAGAGTVVFAGMVAGRPVLSIDHPNGLRTTYEPVVATVSIGQLVARGDPVGILRPGHPGCLAAACLHWGVRRGQDYLDPLHLLARFRVRLLPLR